MAKRIEKSKKENFLNAHVLSKKAQEKYKIIGRTQELTALATALLAHRHVLIEGPVGVGKTLLAQSLAVVLDRKVFRVDGDSRFTEQKLSGWFDPSLVLKKGFNEKSFIAGPLVQAMQTGGILFINELNRLPESVQNILLPAMDENMIAIPQMGVIHAKSGFLVVATQNPKEFVATSHLSEALMDRMEWLYLPYQNFIEEKQIMERVSGFNLEPYSSYIIDIVRMTRNHAKIKRGASVRAAIAIAKILNQVAKSNNNQIVEEDLIRALSLALPTRIELLVNDIETSLVQVFQNLIFELYTEVKKNFIQPSKIQVHYEVKAPAL